MLTEICAEIRNYFSSDSDKHIGNFEISGGVIAPSDFLREGQYFAVFGSTFNDGVYQYPTQELTDESFAGAVWAMRVPPQVLELAAEIEAYTQSDAAKPSAFTSESFGGYSYSRATDSSGAPMSWQTVFASRLKKYRRMRP